MVQLRPWPPCFQSVSDLNLNDGGRNLGCQLLQRAAELREHVRRNPRDYGVLGTLTRRRRTFGLGLLTKGVGQQNCDVTCNHERADKGPCHGEACLQYLVKIGTLPGSKPESEDLTICGDKTTR